MQSRTHCLNSFRLGRIRLGALVVSFVLLAACSQSVDLPPMPVIDTSELLRDVAGQIEANAKKVEQKPQEATTVGRYGLILATYGRDEAANVAFQRARLLAPDEARWAFYHTFVLRRMGKMEEALAAADAGLAASPDQNDLLVKRGEVLFDLSRFDEAEAELDKVLASNPTYPLAQYYKGRIQIQRKDWPLAVARFEKMIDDGIRVSEVHFNLATAYRMTGEAQKAAAQLKLSQGGSNIKIAGYDPVNMKFDTLNVGDQPHVLRAAEHYRSGKVVKAIEELEKAYAKNPNNIGTHVNLVRMYGHNKQLDKAVQHYKEAEAIDPGFNQLESNLGFAYQTAGDYENAVLAYGRAADQTPDNANIQAELGFALGKTGQLEKAIVHLNKSLELQPVNRDLRYILGEALVKQRQFPEAIQMLNSALVPEDQKTIVVLRSLAKVHVLTSNQPAALESLNKALEIATRFDNKALVEALGSDIERVKFAQSQNK